MSVVIDSLDSHIMGLSCDLRNMAEDLIYRMMHGTPDSGYENDCGNSEAIGAENVDYVKDANQLNCGAHLCGMFLYGSINLDEFCMEMIDAGLKTFLNDIPNMPADIATKYGLHYSDPQNPQMDCVDMEDASLQPPDSEIRWDDTVDDWGEKEEKSTSNCVENT